MNGKKKVVSYHLVTPAPRDERPRAALGLNLAHRPGRGMARGLGKPAKKKKRRTGTLTASTDASA